MNAAEKKWDQLYTWLVRYDQNREWMSDWKSQSDIVRWTRTLFDRAGYFLTGGFWSSKLRAEPCLGHVGHCPVGGIWKTRFSFKICVFLSKFDSWAIVLKIEWNLDTRVTSTQGTSFQKRVFPKHNVFPSDFGWTQKTYVLGERGKCIKSKGLEPWICYKIRGRWWDSS
jgi:hypothetical protein